MPTRVRWHARALEDLSRLDRKIQARIRSSVAGVKLLDDARQRLVPYAENLKGFWKLRVGDYRLVCELKHEANGQAVLVIHVAHRSRAYLSRSVRTVRDRADDD